MKLCFALLNDAGVEKLVCAHELQTGEGVYMGISVDTFNALELDKKVEKINDMIGAVVHAADVKRNIKFSEYARQ